MYKKIPKAWPRQPVNKAPPIFHNIESAPSFIRASRLNPLYGNLLLLVATKLGGHSSCNNSRKGARDQDNWANGQIPSRGNHVSFSS
ncbi:hypothetical protein KC19_3G124500 [Ceratodon purpureus]|uniref:Uncharacterized protein n=1 Tax=Ceratodon purpureus TaxID=3225 RepID=A0A8T0IK99_CERPU|nr:hypothetical protein KC19_3G124500 [Ceratodon purpureus]